MPAKKSQTSISVKRVLIALSILLNVAFLGFAIYFYAQFRAGTYDYAIFNYALTGKNINYSAPGNCLYVSKKISGNDSNIKLDAKGRVLSGLGQDKLQCVVLLTPQEADAIQQK